MILKHQPNLGIQGHTYENCEYTVEKMLVLSNQSFHHDSLPALK